MISVVLVEPEIPANTGNVARTCACTGASLYLVGKLGFEITESRVKRAGLDYWDKVHIEHVPTLEELWSRFGEENFFYFSSKARRSFSSVAYPRDAFLVFGNETRGLARAAPRRPRRSRRAHPHDLRRAAVSIFPTAWRWGCMRCYAKWGILICLWRRNDPPPL